LWHRVSRDDLTHAVELALEHYDRNRSMNVWTVCDDYEVRGEAIVARHPFSDFETGKWTTTKVNSRWWRGYHPLEEAPDLFLNLARLNDEPDFIKAALRFSHTFGVLGVDTVKKGSMIDGISLAGFREEAARAQKVLNLYEAVLNRDPIAAHATLHSLRSGLTEVVPESELEAAILEDSGRQALEEHVIHSALTATLKMVNEKVRDLCHIEAIISHDVPLQLPDDPLQLIEILSGALSTDPSVVKSTWRFDNLLGAAYLQMHWLLTSGGNIARCNYCGRVIALTRPHPEGRKRRSDKRFCDDACRQAHHRSKKRIQDAPS
jgi:hypothetical protein